MKNRELVKKLEAAGFSLERHGSNHDIYTRGSDEEQIPRHKEINERLAKAIIKDMMRLRMEVVLYETGISSNFYTTE